MGEITLQDRRKIDDFYQEYSVYFYTLNQWIRYKQQFTLEMDAWVKSWIFGTICLIEASAASEIHWPVAGRFRSTCSCLEIAAHSASSTPIPINFSNRLAYPPISSSARGFAHLHARSCVNARTDLRYRRPASHWVNPAPPRPHSGSKSLFCFKIFIGASFRYKNTTETNFERFWPEV